MFKNLFKKADSYIELYAPVKGKSVDIKTVSDTVFSQELLGRGVAVEPDEEGIVYAPADLTVSQIFDTKHALVLDAQGLEILIHIGFDTVKMGGEGFETFVQLGDKVKRGDKLVKFDINKIREHNHPATTCMVVCNHSDYAEFIKENVNSEVDKHTVVIKLKK